MLDNQTILEIQDFLKNIEDTKPYIQNMFQVMINEFNHTSVVEL